MQEIVFTLHMFPKQNENIIEHNLIYVFKYKCKTHFSDRTLDKFVIGWQCSNGCPSLLNDRCNLSSASSSTSVTC